MVFVIVTGLPGAGKTTVGRALAATAQLPFLDKDDLLEGLFEGSGDPARDRSTLSRQADLTFIGLASELPGAVLVSFWRRPELSETSGTPTEWLHDLPEPVELWCRCAPRVAVHRFCKRLRHPAHGDVSRNEVELLAQFEALDGLGPVGVGRLVEVDTSTEVDGAEVAKRVFG